MVQRVNVGVPKVCLLSLSCIPDDPRVRRQGDALHNAGWSVRAVGLPGAKSSAPEWRSEEAKVSHLVSSLADQSVAATRIAAQRMQRIKSRALLAARMQMSALSEAVALKAVWSMPAVAALYAASQGIKADLWVANDWQMLPLAARLARERGGVFAYDSHELAVSEFMEGWKWRLLKRPFVKAIEEMYIGKARVVSTVSEGIANSLQSFYDLPTRPLVIRNIPPYQMVAPSRASDHIRVLYHGLIAPVRGLEQLIRCVRHLHSTFEVSIRGAGNEDYVASLRTLIEAEGVVGRVDILPPVPMIELVSQAAAFDIGFFCMPRLSKQHEYVLPNKLFEYIMAGLAVCVSDLPEMSRIVREHGVGVLLPSAEPMDIAKVLNDMTRESIASYKATSLKAAKTLCWEEEARSMLAAYEAQIGNI